MMLFKEWLLFCESQTISQYLKFNKEHPQDLIKNGKEEVRKILTRYQNIQQARTHLDKFVGLFTKLWLDTLKNNSLPENTDPISLISGYVSRIMRDYGDFIVAHLNNNIFLSNINKMDYNVDSLAKDSEDWHERLVAKEGGQGSDGTPILTLDHLGGRWKGWKWISLDRAYCKAEAGAMGHCGNANYREGDNIISLRDPDNFVHLTFIVNNSILGESKGRGNSKPSPKHHPAIMELLKSKYIVAIAGGGYKPENNFHFEDLNQSDQKQLQTQKPYIHSYFDYVTKGSPNPIDSLSDMLNIKLPTDAKSQESYKEGTITLELFDDWADLASSLNIDSDIDIGSLDDNDDFMDFGVDIDEAIGNINKDNMQKIKAYLEAEYGEEEDLNDLMKDDPTIEEALSSASRYAMESAYEVSKYEHVIKNLSDSNEEGFYLNFNPWPAKLQISLANLKSLYNQSDDIKNDGLSINGEYANFKYKQPYNGYDYWDIDKEYFNEILRDNLPD